MLPGAQPHQLIAHARFHPTGTGWGQRDVPRAVCFGVPFGSRLRDAGRHDLPIHDEFIRRQPPARCVAGPMSVCADPVDFSDVAHALGRRLGADEVSAGSCAAPGSANRSTALRIACPGNVAKWAVEIRSAETISPWAWFARKLQHSTCPRTIPLQYASLIKRAMCRFPTYSTPRSRMVPCRATWPFWNSLISCMPMGWFFAQ